MEVPTGACEAMSKVGVRQMGAVVCAEWWREYREVGGARQRTSLWRCEVAGT